MGAEAGGCRRCTAGVPITIAEDEHGATLHCFNCNAQWTVPTDPAQLRDELTGISPLISQADLRALAREHDVDPDKYRTPEALIDALAAKAADVDDAAPIEPAADPRDERIAELEEQLAAATATPKEPQ